MRHTIALLAAAGSSSFATFAASGGLPPISELVDERAMLIVEVDDFSELAAAADRAGLKDLIEHPQVVEFLEAYFGGDGSDEDVGLDEVLERLGVDREDLVWPSGRVGLAVSLPAELDEVIESEEFADDEISYRMVVFADLGDGAGVVRDGIEALVDLGLDKGFIEIEEDERVGDARVVTLRSIVRIETDEAMNAFFEEYSRRMEAVESQEDYEALWEWMDSNSPESPFDDLEGVDAAISNLFYASAEFSYTWIGDTFILTNHGESMLDLLDAVEDGLDNAAADAPFFADSLDGLGDGAQIRAALNLSAFFGLSLANAAMMGNAFDPFGVMQDISFTLMGLREMEGLGATVTLDAPEVADMRMRMVVSEKTGWMRLVDLGGEAIELPDFIPAEASGAAVIRADFSRAIELAEEVLKGLAGEQGELARAQSQPFLFLAKPIVESLGDRVLTWSMPASPDELGENPMAGTVIAIPLSDVTALRNVLTGFGGTVGLAPREFGGAQVFESETMPMSVGLGNGYVVIGATARVEDTLRLAGSPRGGGLAATEEFRDAIAALGDANWVGISYQNTERYFEQLFKMSEAYDEQQAEWFEE